MDKRMDSIRKRSECEPAGSGNDAQTEAMRCGDTSSGKAWEGDRPTDGNNKLL
jgi:hypothetical protein